MFYAWCPASPQTAARSDPNGPRRGQGHTVRKTNAAKETTALGGSADARDYTDNAAAADFFRRVITGDTSMSSREFHHVVDAGMQKLRRVAKRNEVAVSEMLSYAAEAWMESPKLFAESENFWGRTITAAGMRAASHAAANRIGTTADTVKNERRAGREIDFSTAPSIVQMTTEDETRLEVPPARSTSEAAPRGTAAMIAIDLVEASAGWDRSRAADAVDAVLDAAAMYAENGYQQRTDTVEAGVRLSRLLARLTEDKDLNVRIGITRAELLGLAALLLISRSGAPGILWLTAVGQDIDPQAKNIRMAVNKIRR